MNENIYLEYHDKVAGYVHARINQYHDAEDLISTVFLKVYSKLDSFDSSKASISTWIYTITANTVKDYYKTHKIHEELPMDLGTVEEIDEEFLHQELLQDLANSLKRLPVRERDLIILHYYEEITIKKISEMMSMSYQNAKLIHKSALTRLRGRIAKIA